VCTPAVQQVAVLIASPIALLVALWGMSGVRALEQIEAHRVQTPKISNSNSCASSSVKMALVSSRAEVYGFFTLVLPCS